MEGELLLVDLPGYGYAQVSKAERRRWEPLVEDYLATRGSLWGVVLVIDGRRAPMENDIQMADYLGQAGLSWMAALTKSDKAKQNQRAKVMKESEGLLRSLGARHLLQVSAMEARGMAPVWEALADLGPVVPS
ncbi:GTP-binding protein [Gemmatimonadota bacterium]